jgi:RecA-family ATPase
MVSRGNGFDDGNGSALDVGFSRENVQHLGQTYTREVDGAWRDEHRRTLKRDGNGGWIIEEPAPLWQTEHLSKWSNKYIPPRQWFIEEWIPLGQCTGLYGIPGARKSLWILQALISGALGHHFCGLPIIAGPVLGLFCEDTEEELARRAERILRRYGRSFADLDNCYYTSLVGAEVTEFMTFTASGRMILTPAFATFRQQLHDIKPRLAALDVGVDFFAGNENDRTQVGRFIRLLDRIGLETGCAVLFAAHPSRRGIAEGLLDSGSTAWEAKVRGRLVLHDPAADGEEKANRNAITMLNVSRNPSDERVLTRAKCNYAAPGAQIELVLRDDVFVPKAIDTETAAQRGPMRNQAAEAKFLELLGKVNASGRWVHDSPTAPSRYAPRVFSGHPDCGGFREREFQTAMERLLGSGRIRLGSVSRAGRKNPALEEAVAKP